MASRRAEIKKLRRQMEEGARMHEQLLRENARIAQERDELKTDIMLLRGIKPHADRLARAVELQAVELAHVRRNPLGRWLLRRYE